MLLLLQEEWELHVLLVLVICSLTLIKKLLNSEINII